MGKKAKIESQEGQLFLSSSRKPHQDWTIFDNAAWDNLPTFVKDRVLELVEDAPYMSEQSQKEQRSQMQFLDWLFGENF